MTEAIKEQGGREGGREEGRKEAGLAGEGWRDWDLEGETERLRKGGAGGGSQGGRDYYTDTYASLFSSQVML